MRLTLIATLCSLMNDAPPDVKIERLFGPETPTGRYKHPASLTEPAGGDLYLAWYGGDGEYAPGTAVWQAPDVVVWLWYVIVLINGDYLLPVWKEPGFDTEVVGADTASFFLRYDPRARKWSESSRMHSRLGALTPAVAQIDDAYLVAYCRRV